MAGENRSELEKVLKKYEHDELKYRAAVFLIENMIYHQYRAGEWVEIYNKYFEYYGTGRYTPEEVYEKIKQEEGDLYSKSWVLKKDIEEVDSAYLTGNIEWAFKVWQEQPWGKNISFDEFCEQILPYRTGNETLSIWREELYNHYNPLLDDFRKLPEAKNPLLAARKIIELLAEEGAYWTTSLPQGPHVGPLLVKWKSGTCREMSDIVIYVLRALGIPCGMDYFLIYGDSNEAHLWTYIPDKEGHIYIYDFPDTLIRPAANLNMRKAKVYRKTFGLNSEDVIRMGEMKGGIYPSFSVPLFKDVTAIYKDSIQVDLVIPASSFYRQLPPAEIIHLCNSQYNQWLPVAWSKRKGDSISFKDVDTDGVFLLAVWQNNQLQLITDPFYLEPGGDVRFIRPTDELQDITVLSKHIKKETYLYRMAGGVFEGSNYPDFRTSDTLYVIPQSPERLYTPVWLTSGKEYRYIRYYGPPHSFCNVSEVAFLYRSGGVIYCWKENQLVALGVISMTELISTSMLWTVILIPLLITKNITEAG